MHTLRTVLTLTLTVTAQFSNWQCRSFSRFNVGISPLSYGRFFSAAAIQARRRPDRLLRSSVGPTMTVNPRTDEVGTVHVGPEPPAWGAWRRGACTLDRPGMEKIGGRNRPANTVWAHSHRADFQFSNENWRCQSLSSPPRQLNIRRV
jgi:hypothetical protein